MSDLISVKNKSSQWPRTHGAKNVKVIVGEARRPQAVVEIPAGFFTTHNLEFALCKTGLTVFLCCSAVTGDGLGPFWKKWHEVFLMTVFSEELWKSLGWNPGTHYAFYSCPKIIWKKRLYALKVNNKGKERFKGFIAEGFCTWRWNTLISSSALALVSPSSGVFLPGMFFKGGSWSTAACSQTEEEGLC